MVIFILRFFFQKTKLEFHNLEFAKPNVIAQYVCKNENFQLAACEK